MLQELLRSMSSPRSCFSCYSFHKLVRPLHFRFDLIEIRLQLFHVSLCCWPANPQTLLLVRFGYLVFVRRAHGKSYQQDSFAYHVEVNLQGENISTWTGSWGLGCTVKKSIYMVNFLVCQSPIIL